MSKRSIYVCHIVTSVDIEQEINKSLQPYPIVHHKGEYETCTVCNQQECQARETGGDSAHGGPDGVGRISQPNVQELCAGPMGLCTMRMAAEESDGETEEPEDIPSEKEVTTMMSQVLKEWESYRQSARLSPKMITQLEAFMMDLLNSSLCITEHEEWHLIYISGNRQRRFNSRLGRLIRQGQYKNRSVGCVTCPREYLYSGNGRQILQDVLTAKHIEASQCAEHKCGLDGDDIWKKATYQIDCAERRDSIYGHEVESFEERNDRVVDAIIQTNDDNIQGLHGGNRHKVRGKAGQVLDARKDGTSCDDGAISGEIYCDNNRNANIIVILCKNGAFTESEAMGIFAKSHRGINLICSKQYHEKIRTYIGIARILVFQESFSKAAFRSGQAQV